MKLVDPKAYLSLTPQELCEQHTELRRLIDQPAEWVKYSEGWFRVALANPTRAVFGRATPTLGKYITQRRDDFIRSTTGLHNVYCTRQEKS